MAVCRRRTCLAAVTLLLLSVCNSMAWAQEEIPPPQGTGRVVVVVSGQAGPTYIHAEAEQIAGLGYDVILADGNDMTGSNGQKLHDVIVQAQQAPHAVAGKVAVVGYSLGGGMALFYAAHWPELVAGIVVWYPLTAPIHDYTKFASSVSVPVLMFAGEQDTYLNCCVIASARAISAAAAQTNAPVTVVTYPNAGHDFVVQGEKYDPEAAPDSFARAAAALAAYLK